MKETIAPHPMTPKQQNLPFLVIGLALLAGLILSIISLLHVCSESCSATHDYRFFGMSFEPMGLTFFTVAICLHVLSKKYHFLALLVAIMIAGGLGTELMLILVQKLEIGHWCPVCLSIAGTLAVAGSVFLIVYIQGFMTYLKKGDKDMIARSSIRGVLAITAAVAGFLLAFSGVSKPEASIFAENDSLKKADPIFGKRDSNVEVYIITDWFCPACRSIEPVLEKLYPQIATRAGLMFVDFPIHPDSVNYIPYNLSFMLKEKPKYFQIRKALQDLALTNKAPTIQDVQGAVASLKVTYQPLNYVDVDSGMRYFEEIAKTFDVKSTPSIIITNRKTHASKVLHGTLQITEKDVLQEIKTMSSTK